MKKIKPLNYLPPVQNGVVAASRTPSIDEGRLLDIETGVRSKINEGSLSIFFNFNDQEKELKSMDDIPKYQISDSVKTVLGSHDADEVELRNAVFTDMLDNHNIKFLPSSCSEDTDKNHNKKYKESHMQNLLPDLAQKSGEGTTAEKMNRIMLLEENLTTA